MPRPPPIPMVYVKTVYLHDVTNTMFFQNNLVFGVRTERKMSCISHNKHISVNKTIKVGRGNLERGVTWNETLSCACCTKMGAVRETLWGVVGGKSTYFLVVSCRAPGSNLTGSSYGDFA